MREGASGAHPPAVTNFEIKACDAAGNPYLILSAVIAAGMDGLRNKLKLGAPVGEWRGEGDGME